MRLWRLAQPFTRCVLIHYDTAAQSLITGLELLTQSLEGTKSSEILLYAAESVVLGVWANVFVYMLVISGLCQMSQQQSTHGTEWEDEEIRWKGHTHSLSNRWESWILYKSAAYFIFFPQVLYSWLRSPPELKLGGKNKRGVKLQPGGGVANPQTTQSLYSNKSWRSSHPSTLYVLETKPPFHVQFGPLHKPVPSRHFVTTTQHNFVNYYQLEENSAHLERSNPFSLKYIHIIHWTDSHKRLIHTLTS